MSDIRNLKVLVADDHFLARQIITDVMRELSILDVMAVGDGVAARDALNQAMDKGKPFEVVFLDRSMPHLDGFEILKQCRAIPEFASTAFIMFTAISEQNEVLQAVKAGAVGYLIKPVTKLAIHKKMKEISIWLDKQRKPLT